MPINAQTIYRVLLTGIFTAIVFNVASFCSAADTDSDSGDLLDQEAFDSITLSDAAGGETVKVYPIDFPNRRVPTDADPMKEVEVTLLIYPDRKYKVKWGDIAKVDLYEEKILAASQKYLANKDYALSFEYLTYLLNNYPNTQGLVAAKEKFLIDSATGMFTDGDYSHALAVLEEIRRSDPNLEPAKVNGAISNVAAKLIESYFAEDELEIAQRMVARLEKDYGSKIPAVAIWRDRFRKLAENYQNESEELLEEGKFNEAFLAARKMLDIDPSLAGGEALLEKINASHPILRVGVFQSATTPDPTSLGDWPSRRIGALVTEPLFQFEKTGPEGGVYDFVLGAYEQSDDQTELMLRFSSSALKDASNPNAYQVAHWMLRKATVDQPQYNAAWASVFRNVEVDGEDYLRIKLNQSNVLPASFLQWPLDELRSDFNSVGKGLYVANGEIGNSHVYTWNSEQEAAKNQPVEVIEMKFEQPYQAISSLINRRIDVIDRIFPADAASLAKDDRIRVENYALPIVHMLVPKGENPYIQELMFRRALLYAIDRESIMRGVLLGGPLTEESRPISGPFPIGSSGNDPLAYAYNENVKPVAYEPNLAKLLVLITKDQFAKAAEANKTEVPNFREIVLGVPDYEAARVAGEAFVQQWARIDVKARVVVMNESNKDVPLDLLYVTAAMWEPAIDADRLLGEGGMAQTDSPYIVQALTKLRLARNWRQVRAAAQDLHQLVDAHLPVLPLWQIGEMFAYSSEVAGVPTRPVTLYQNLQQWRLNKTASIE